MYLQMAKPSTLDFDISFVVVSDKMLGRAIQQWYEKQNPNAAFLNPLFKNIDDSPRYTKILLQALNKA